MSLLSLRASDWPFIPLAVYARGRREFDILAAEDKPEHVVQEYIRSYLEITNFKVSRVPSGAYRGQYQPPVQCWHVENFEA